MVEDRLTRAERVRLEALAQSIACGQMKNESTKQVLDRALEFEAFIKAAREDA